ncbi:phosphoribosyltransferase [Devosia albogilva]|uniref:Phosphoribosyltransferase n=1 Tax=Devosia albogilva TaxID=429726 RepID=A0ABW5QF03_9HYPH
MPLEPHQFWQAIAAPGTYPEQLGGYVDSYPARFADGRQLLLPLRVLPGDGQHAVASLIVNQASFAVEDALASAITELARPLQPEVIIGVPTLGLLLASNVARRLGHARMVPLGTSRKFWYREEYSEPMSSITSPTHGKTLFVDPRMLPLLAGRRVVVVDDVISSGSSMGAVLRLLGKCGIEPVGVLAAMLQGAAWRQALGPWTDRVAAPLTSPRFRRSSDGRWCAEELR